MRAGRVDRALLEKVGFAPNEHPRVYVCGPTGFVEAVASALVRLNHPPGAYARNVSDHGEVSDAGRKRRRRQG